MVHDTCVFYRLNREDAKRLFGCRSPESLATFVAELEDRPQAARLIVAGEGLVLHRLLTDGTLNPEAGEYPFNHAVLGGRVMAAGNDLAVVLKRPDMCPHIAAGLAQTTEADVQERYTRLHASQPDLAAGTSPAEVAAAHAKLADLYREAAAAAEAVILVRRS